MAIHEMKREAVFPADTALQQAVELHHHAVPCSCDVAYAAHEEIGRAPSDNLLVPYTKCWVRIRRLFQSGPDQGS